MRDWSPGVSDESFSSMPTQLPEVVEYQYRWPHDPRQLDARFALQDLSDKENHHLAAR
ncbi:MULTISPECIES: hypothetical protein [unclassified Variovorax]|uniref:hypothetical protein n=1 Tax=unclassified Variovorax TaxID=663243 RepID=UPI003ECF5410